MNAFDIVWYPVYCVAERKACRGVLSVFIYQSSNSTFWKAYKNKSSLWWMVQIYFSHVCRFWLWNMCIIFDCIAKVVGVLILTQILLNSSEMFLVHGIFCSLFPFDYSVHGDTSSCLIHVIGFIFITWEPIQFLKHLNGLLGNTSQLQCNSYMLSRTSKFIKINSNAILKLMMRKQSSNARIITLLWLFLR